MDLSPRIPATFLSRISLAAGETQFAGLHGGVDPIRLIRLAEFASEYFGRKLCQRLLPSGPGNEKVNP
jgi:hypothetical protein